MVEVFKTNVQEVSQAKELTDKLLEHFPDYDITFDLEDCDKILRAEARDIKSENIIMLLSNYGFNCECLAD